MIFRRLLVTEVFANGHPACSQSEGIHAVRSEFPFSVTTSGTAYEKKC
jgi:hypothetical protein